MCRHLAYLGPPKHLATLLIDPPHSLRHQSWAPDDMRGGGTINADGFGVGWYTDTGPVRYRSISPMWSDVSFADLAKVTTARAVLAAVRSATPGMMVAAAACAPFTADGWLFSHNGVISGWPASVADLARELPVVDLLTLDAPTDSALLWAMLRRRLQTGLDPTTALVDTVAAVSVAAPGSRLNLLLTNGTRIYATSVGHSLAIRHLPGEVIVASEPIDTEPGWLTLPDRRVAVADLSMYTVEEL